MQKKLIALAIAGLSGAAFAQSNVTIYGVADGTYDNVKADSATIVNGTTATGLSYQSRGRTTMNSSYVGFKGTESLGNGLAVAFQVETGFGENAGATNTTGVPAVSGWATRDTYVGLAGGFGTVAFGNLTGPARAMGAKYDVNAGATGIGANTALLGKVGGGSGAGYIDSRFANAIAYISPNMGGFSGVLAYVPNENRSRDVNSSATASADTDAWTLGLSYSNGPISVDYAYTGIKDKNANSAVASSGLGLITGFNNYVGNAFVAKVTDNRLGLKYDGGQFTVGLLYDVMKADVDSVAGTGAVPAAGNTSLSAAAIAFGSTQQVQSKTWYIPVTFTVGSGKIIAQYGKTSASGTLYDTLATLVPGLSKSDFDAKHIELGYEYSLSKRTTVKALWSQITNSKYATYDFLYGVSNPNTANPGAGVNGGSDPRGFSLGLRHSF